ncbi:DUF393 domain-containing protein [bacterium]|nr:DUF393 domain-containing protein [bacterium]NCQ55349.1 DUF393 domain-containing protein [Candidatus Parcubacteria bacterium]NCS96764.1 DUF393 domain-containing protein [bacterium]
MQKPSLIYDGDCEFCQYCVDYFKKVTEKQISFIDYQTNTFGISEIDCAKSIHLVVNEIEIYRGSAAAFKALSYGDNNRGWWLYQHLPGFSTLSERIYKWITRHRSLCYRMAKIILGNPWKVGRITFILWTIIALILALTFFKNL